MTLLIVGTIRLAPDRVDDARPVMARMVSASRAEDGCLAYSYAEDMLDRGLVHVIERWRDHASLERHFATDHLAAWREAWPALGLGERDLALYEVGDPRAV